MVVVAGAEGVCWWLILGVLCDAPVWELFVRLNGCYLYCNGWSKEEKRRTHPSPMYTNTTINLRCHQNPS